MIEKCCYFLRYVSTHINCHLFLQNYRTTVYFRTAKFPETNEIRARTKTLRQALRRFITSH